MKKRSEDTKALIVISSIVVLGVVGVAWLASRMANQGRTLEAGQIVLAGAFIRPFEVGKGDTIVADYGAFGSVSVHFG